MIDLFTLAAAAATPEAEPRLLGLDAEGWVYVGITIFFAIAIFYAKAHLKVRDVLDAHIANASKALDEAAAIRAEAETYLAEAKAKLEASTSEAAQMLHQAGVEADVLIAKAEKDTADIIARREKMAHEKIATAERAAVEQLRMRAGTAAIGTAGDVIAKSHDAGADQSLVDEAIASL